MKRPTRDIHAHMIWRRALRALKPWAVAAVMLVLFVSAQAAAQDAAPVASDLRAERMLEVFTVVSLCVVLLLLKWSDRGKVEPPPPITSLLEWAPDENGEFSLGDFSASLDGVEMVHSGQERRGLSEPVATPLPDSDKPLTSQTC